jgi:hypothetical protein
MVAPLQALGFHTQKIEITASSEIATAMAAQAQQRTTSCMTLRVPFGYAREGRSEKRRML